MKQKDFEVLKIKNGKLIIEAGGSEFSSEIEAFSNQALQLGKDALKMTWATFKRVWYATFVLGWNILMAAYKRDLALLHNANEEFRRNDKQIKNEQQQLVNSQPGNKDAAIFTAMTCPAAAAYTAFVDSDLSGLRKGTHKAWHDIFDKKSEEEEAKFAYYSLLIGISHVLYGTSIRTNLRREHKKPKFRKYFKSILKNIDEEAFKKMIRMIAYSSRISVNDKREIVFNVEEEEYHVLKLLHDSKNNNSEGKIIRYITKSYITNSINNITYILNSKENLNALRTSHNEFDSSREMRDFTGTNQSRADEALSIPDLKLNISKNNLLLKEEEETKNKKITAKEAQQLSFSSYHIMKAIILASKNKTFLNRIYVNLDFNRAKLIALKNKATIENKDYRHLIELIKEIEEQTNKCNKQIELFRLVFKEKIDKIDTADFNKDCKDIINDINKMNKQTSNIKEEQKDKVYAGILTDVLSDAKMNISSLNIKSDLKSDLNDFKLIIEECEKSIYHDVLNRYENILSIVGLNKNAAGLIEIRKNDINSTIKKISDSEAVIKEFTTKKEEIKSIADESNEEEKKEDNEIKKNKYLGSRIVDQKKN